MLLQDLNINFENIGIFNFRQTLSENISIKFNCNVAVMFDVANFAGKKCPVFHQNNKLIQDLCPYHSHPFNTILSDIA